MKALVNENDGTESVSAMDEAKIDTVIIKNSFFVLDRPLGSDQDIVDIKITSNQSEQDETKNFEVEMKIGEVF